MTDTAVDIMGNATGGDVTATAPAATTRVDLKAQFAQALNVGWWEGLTSSNQEIIAARTPDQIVDAFRSVNPAWTPALDIIDQDEALKTALHNALAKDPKALDGLAAMAAEGSGVQPAEFAQTLSDPMRRGIVTQALNKIAENPNDEFDFDDFRELYDNRNNQRALIAKLGSMGINPASAVSADQMFSMVREALMSPTGFRDLFAQLPAMMGLSGEQAKAFGDLANFAGGYLDLCLGTREDGIRGVINKYGDQAVAGVTDFGQRITGQRDEEIARQQREAGQGTPVDPASGVSGQIREATATGGDPSAPLRDGFTTGADGSTVPAQTSVYDTQVAEWSHPRQTQPGIQP